MNDLPSLVTILRVEDGWAGSPIKGFLHHSGQPGGSDGLPIYSPAILADAKRFCAANIPVRVFVDYFGKGKASVSSITRPPGHSFLVTGSGDRFLEVNPYHQRWYWASLSRLACPLTEADAIALCAAVQVADVDDAMQDPAARVIADYDQRHPRTLETALPIRQPQTRTA